MKSHPWLIVATIAAGVLLLQFSFVNGGEGNWDPIHLPFPGPGFTVADTFELASGGNFMLQVITSATKEETGQLHPEQPDVKCDLALIITGPRHFRREDRIVSFHNGGWSRNSNFYLLNRTYPLPRRGTYELTLTSGRLAGTFSERGAVVELVRIAPVGPQFGYAIARLIGYASFVAACILVVASSDRAAPSVDSPSVRAE